MHVLSSTTTTTFDRNSQRLLQHLKLYGLQPTAINAYARAVRRLGVRFDSRVDDLSTHLFTDDFAALLASHYRSSVKLDLYGLKFFFRTLCSPR